MHPHVPEARWSLPAELRGIPNRSPPPALNPPGIAEVTNSIPLPLAVFPAEDIDGVLPTHLFQQRLGHVVQDDDPCLTVLHPRRRQHEHAPLDLGRVQSRHPLLPAPLQAT